MGRNFVVEKKINPIQEPRMGRNKKTGGFSDHLVHRPARPPALQVIDLVKVLPDNSHAEHQQARRKKNRNDLCGKAGFYFVKKFPVNKNRAHSECDERRKQADPGHHFQRNRGVIDYRIEVNEKQTEKRITRFTAFSRMMLNFHLVEL